MTSSFSVRRLCIVVGVCVALTGCLTLTGAASAQSANNTTATPTDSPGRNATIAVSAGGTGGNECSERVSADLSICSASYEEGTAILVLESERTMRLTLTDAGAFITGGQVERESATVFEGRNTIRFRATEVQGFAGVAVDTGNVLYAKRIQALSPSQPAISYSSVQALIAVTAVGAAAFTYRLVRRKREEESPEWERVL